MARPSLCNASATQLPAPDTTAPQSNILDALPSELLSRIFSKLSSDPPHDIAACRLVSHRFRDISSPFLLPRVVFARRLGALTKLREVLQHPYFRRHVTRLVYDGSRYAESTAMNWDQHVDDCERAPRDLEDTEWADRQRRDRIAWEELGLFRMHDFMKASPGDNSMGSIADGPMDGVERGVAPDVESSRAFRLGCHKTFPNYMQRQADQRWIGEQRVDSNILAAVFAAFPKLRSIVFADYRGLVRDGESYDACCRRLFGKMLEPEHAGIGGETGPGGHGLFFLLDVLAQRSKVHIDSLAIGPHAFEYTGEDTSELADPNHPQNSQFLDISALEDVSVEPEAKLVRVLNHLRHLRLAICYSGCRSDEEHMRDQLRKLLQASTPHLQSLTLHMIYLFWGGLSVCDFVRSA